MDKQRNEDLNPHNEDIEEKVRQMLDPSVPDAPEVDLWKTEPSKPKSSSKIKVNDAVKVNDTSAKTSPVLSSSDDSTPSAPELPGVSKDSSSKTEVKPPSRIKSKKLIIPINHDTDEQSSPTEPKDSKKSGNSDESSEPAIKKITINEHEDSADEVEEKLNEVIAGLGEDDKNSPVEEPENKSDKSEVANEKSKDDNSEPEAPVVTVADAIESSKQSDGLMPIDDDSELTTESEIISDPKTDKAVAEIVASEGDELLEIEDAVRDTDEPVKKTKKPRKKFLATLKALWAKPNFRWFMAGVLALVIVGLGMFPVTRYFILNTAGVRSKSTLQIMDQSTHQPLKNVLVSVGGVSSKTDEQGNVSLQKVRLGSSALKIEKRAFATINKTVVIGLGSNPLGDFSLTPTGSQYSFTVTDFLSGKPVSKIEAVSGESSAISDENGLIKLTIDSTYLDNIEVSIGSSGYRSEKINLNLSEKTTQSIKLVAARKQVFISKRSGKYDIYSIYIDGKDEKLILPGSGNEKDNLALAPNPKDDVTAYVSTRAGQTNSDGFMLSNLVLINSQDNNTTNVVASEKIQIIDWTGDNLVYVQTASGASANSPKRQRLMSYNYKTKSNKELSSSNYFNDVVSANGIIYFARSSAYQTGKVGLEQVNPDGSGQKNIFDQEVWNIFRTSFDDLALAVQQQWYTYRLGSTSPTKINAAPPNQASRVYISSPDAKHSTWFDNRDGKGTLVIYDNDAKKDAVLVSQSGLKYPANWLNNKTVVYRVKTDQETADYAVSIDGGDPVKIRDVTDSSGIDRYFY